MSPDQDFAVTEGFQFFMTDDPQPCPAQPFHLHAVVHDVAKAVKDRLFCKFTLRDADGINHTKTEAGTRIDGNLQTYCFLVNSRRLMARVM